MGTIVGFRPRESMPNCYLGRAACFCLSCLWRDGNAEDNDTGANSRSRTEAILCTGFRASRSRCRC